MEHLLSRLESNFAPDQAVASDSNGSYSAGEISRRGRALARQLEGHGVRRLVLHGDNGTDWMIADFACQAAGVCLVPLPTFFSTHQLRHILGQVAPDALLTTRAKPLAPLATGPVPRRLEADGTAFDLLLLDTGNDTGLPRGTDKITFTSGSTGTPKGVCLSSSQLLVQAQALVAATGLRAPRHLCLLPLSTLLENVAGIYAPLLAGGETVIPTLAEVGFEGSSSLDPRAFTETIARHAPDSIILTPQLLEVLIAAAESGWPPPRSLVFAAVGGGRVSPALVERAHALGIPAFEGYGLSECASVVSLNTATDHDHATSGRPLPHLAVDIVDGEIVISGNAMLGYVGEPASWNPQRIHSGDLGSVDERGFLTIDGRVKNVLVSSYGRNINPEWIESEMTARAGFRECVVFGDSRPWCVALLSPLDPGRRDTDIQRAVDAVNATLPDYARVNAWHRLHTPLAAEAGLLTANGRPRREAIASRYRAIIDSLYPDNTRTISA